MLFWAEEGLRIILNVLKDHDLKRIVERLLLENNLPTSY